MITIPVSYENISPEALISIIEFGFEGSRCWYKNIDKDYFELAVACENYQLEGVEAFMDGFLGKEGDN